MTIFLVCNFVVTFLLGIAWKTSDVPNTLIKGVLLGLAMGSVYFALMSIGVVIVR